MEDPISGLSLRAEARMSRYLAQILLYDGGTSLRSAFLAHIRGGTGWVSSTVGHNALLVTLTTSRTKFDATFGQTQCIFTCL